MAHLCVLILLEEQFCSQHSSHHSHIKLKGFLGILYRLASINVGPPHPTLIWTSGASNLQHSKDSFQSRHGSARSTELLDCV